MNVAKATYAPASTLATSDTGDQPVPCVKSLNDSLARVATIRDDIIAATTADKLLKPQLEALAKAQQALAEAQTALKAAPKDKELIAKVAKLGAEVTAIKEKIGKQKLALPGLIAERDALLKRLTTSVTIQWMPALQTAGGPICRAVTAPFKQFATDFVDDTVSSFDEALLRRANVQVEAFTMWLCPENPAAGALPTLSKGAVSAPPQAGLPMASDGASGPLAAPAIPANGLVYRWPTSARLVAYAADEHGTMIPTQRHPITGESLVAIAQFGQKGDLRLTNGTFDKNTLKAVFTESGALSSLNFTAQSSAERGSAAINDVSAQYAALRELRAKAEKAKADAKDTAAKKALDDELSSLDQQISLLGKQQQLDLARTLAAPL